MHNKSQGRVRFGALLFQLGVEGLVGLISARSRSIHNIGYLDDSSTTGVTWVVGTDETNKC